MKKLLSWGGIGLLTTALLDPLIYSMLDKPVPWWRDIVMALAGAGCLYLLVKFRNELRRLDGKFQFNALCSGAVPTTRFWGWM